MRWVKKVRDKVVAHERPFETVYGPRRTSKDPSPLKVKEVVPVHGPRPVPEGHLRIARRFNAGFWDPPQDESPVGTVEGFAHTFPQSSLRDSKEDNKLHHTQASMPGLFSCRPYGTWNTAGYPVNGYV